MSDRWKHIESSCRYFYDKNGRLIKPGHLIKLSGVVNHRERPGHRRVVEKYDHYSTLPDEGDIVNSREEWVLFRVGWDGACMVARRESESDFQSIMNGESEVDLRSATHLMNHCFKSLDFEVVNGEEVSDE